MGKQIRRFQTWMMENAYLVTIGCVIAIVAGCAIYTQDLRERQDVQAAAGAPEIRETALPTSMSSITPLPTIAPLAVRTEALVQRGGVWPVAGSVMRVYDAQKSVYWASISVWQTHMGLDIGGQPGESVRACLDGTVISTAWDTLWGWRVCIAHDGERETRYAGLESCSVQAGAHVRRGQTIGTLMESIPCEAELDTHLHLEMLREGKRQDPEASLAER